MDPGREYFEAQSDGEGEASRMHEYHMMRNEVAGG